MFAVCDPGLTPRDARDADPAVAMRPVGQGDRPGVPGRRADHRPAAAPRSRRGCRSWAGCPTWTTCLTSAPGGTPWSRALYLLFNEGYHGSDPDEPAPPVPVRRTPCAWPSCCSRRKRDGASGRARAGRAVLLRRRPPGDPARRGRRVRPARGAGPGPLGPGAASSAASLHLARRPPGDHMSRWHLEAGIACEHAIAPSVREDGLGPDRRATIRSSLMASPGARSWR